MERNTANWLSPSRRLEEEVSVAIYERFRACTAALDAEQLVGAYRSTWEWSTELMTKLFERHALQLPTALFGDLDRYLASMEG